SPRQPPRPRPPRPLPPNPKTPPPPRHILVQRKRREPSATPSRATTRSVATRHPNQHQQRRQHEAPVGTDTDTLAELITDLMDLPDPREAFWSNDLAGDALLRESGPADKPTG